MNNRIAALSDESQDDRKRGSEDVHRLDDLLEEFLTHYERRFARTRIAVVETRETSI